MHQAEPQSAARCGAALLQPGEALQDPLAGLLRDAGTEVLDNERLTGAVLDRLTHRCHILEATGESYRLKDARRRSSKKKPPRNPPPSDESKPE